MATANSPAIETTQVEPSALDIVRAEARDEVRQLFAQLGLSAETLKAIGCTNPSALAEVEDED